MDHYYTVRFDGCRERCEHAHRSWEAAERCAARTIRMARDAVAGDRPRFDGDEWIAKWYPLDDPGMAVHRETVLG